MYFRLGQAHDRQKSHQAAVSYFEKAIELNGDLLPAYKNMALAYDNLGNHKQALECLRRALEIEEASA